MLPGGSPAGGAADRSSLCARRGGPPEHVGQKINLQRLLTDLGMQGFHIDRRILGTALSLGVEELSGPCHQLAPPLGNLIRMNIEALCQLGQRGFSL
jgi:hypothetical protein